MIFSLAIGSIAKKSHISILLNRSSNGYMSANRSALQTAENNLYKSIKSIKTKPKIQDHTSPPNTPSNKRTIDPIKAKVNILSLLIDNKDASKDLYNLTANLIKILYEKSDFYKNAFEFQILDEIIEALKMQNKKQKPLNLPELTLKMKKNQKIYYKMLKGSKFYNFNKSIGYPSLLDFITISPGNNEILLKGNLTNIAQKKVLSFLIIN